MKKPLLSKLTLALSILCLNYSVSAQSFAPVGATWHYTERFAFDPSISFFKIESVSDSLFMGKNCRLLVKNHEFQCEQRPLQVLVYDEDSVLYFWDEAFSEFQLLADFTKIPGESWFVKIKDQSQETDTIVVSVTNSGTITISGLPLKILTVDYSASYGMNWSSVIIERIGDPNYLFNYHPEMVQFCDANYSQSLRCYEDTVLGLYHQDTIPDCEYQSVGMQQAENQKWLKCYPNPATHSVKISGFDPELIKSIHLFDLSGRKIAHFKNQDELDISGQENGVYELLIETKSGIFREKLLIQR